MKNRTRKSPLFFAVTYVLFCFWRLAAAKNRSPRQPQPKRRHRSPQTHPFPPTPLHHRPIHPFRPTHPNPQPRRRRKAHPLLHQPLPLHIDPDRARTTSRTTQRPRHDLWQGRPGSPSRQLGVYGKRADGGWYKICCINSQVAWIAKDFAQLSGDVAKIPVVEAPPLNAETQKDTVTASTRSGGAGGPRNGRRSHRQCGPTQRQPAIRQVLWPVQPTRQPGRFTPR